MIAKKLMAVAAVMALSTVFFASVGCNKFFDTEATLTGAAQVNKTCPTNMYFNNGACEACTNGLVANQTECHKCKAGETVNDNRCERCIGTVLAGSPNDSCVACAKNQTWSPTKGCVNCEGQVVDGACKACDKNQIFDGNACAACNGLVVNNVCIACDPGTYFNGRICTECNGVTKDGACYGCKVGQTLVDNECKDCNGVVYAGHCIACEKPGDYFNGVACTACTTGPVVEAQCTACKPNQTFIQTGNSSVCTDCINGQVVNGQCVACTQFQTWNSGTKLCENCTGKVVDNACVPCAATETFIPGIGCEKCNGVVYNDKCYQCARDEIFKDGKCTKCNGIVDGNQCVACAGVVLNNKCVVCDAAKNEYVGADAMCHACKGVALLDSCNDCPAGQFWDGKTCSTCQGRMKNALTCEPCTAKEMWKDGVGCVADDRRKNFCLEVFPTTAQSKLDFNQADENRIGVLRVSEINWPWAEWYMNRLPGTPGDRVAYIGYTAHGDLIAQKSSKTDFRVCGDDGVRLVINGQTLVNSNREQMGTCFDVRVQLTQGANPFEISYFQGPGRHAQFQWLKKANGAWVPVSGEDVEACDPTQYTLPGLFPKVTEVRETFDVCHARGWPGTVTRSLKSAPVQGIGIPEIRNHVVGAFTYPSHCYNSGSNAQENHIDVPNGCGDEVASIFASSVAFNPSSPTVQFKTAVAWAGGRTCHYGQYSNVLYQIQADMNKLAEILHVPSEVVLEKEVAVVPDTTVRLLGAGLIPTSNGTSLFTANEVPPGFTISRMTAVWTKPNSCRQEQQWLKLHTDKRNAYFGSNCGYGQVRLKVKAVLKR